MAVVHRALFTWFMLLVFLIFLALRLDEKTTWNWFLVFIPMWLFDSFILIYVTFKLITHCKNGHNWWLTVHRKLWYLCCILLKMGFQAGLCAKLEYGSQFAIPVYYIFIPVCVLLVGASADVFKGLLTVLRY